MSGKPEKASPPAERIPPEVNTLLLLTFVTLACAVVALIGLAQHSQFVAIAAFVVFLLSLALSRLWRYRNSGRPRRVLPHVALLGISAAGVAVAASVMFGFGMLGLLLGITAVLLLATEVYPRWSARGQRAAHPEALEQKE